MNWAPLILAAVIGTPAAILLIHRKAPRAAAVLMGLAVLCILAGVPAILSALGHPLGAGPVLMGVVVVTIAAAMFFYLDVIRGHHKSPLMGRKGEAHHLRPLMSAVVLVVAGLLISFNWPAVTQAISHGTGQTLSTIGHSGRA